MNTPADPRETTLLLAEALAAPGLIAAGLAANHGAMAALAARLRANPPRIILTVARGSSDHAATFLKFLAESRLSLPVVSQPPSVVSAYGADVSHWRGQLVVLISQSGKSPDLLANAAAARAAGATVVALLNNTAAPLADVADIVIPLHAGPERSVAATKSYLAALAAIAQLVALWSADPELLAALDALPAQLAAAAAADWSAGADLLAAGRPMFVLGRGETLAIAGEAALKLKETSGIFAEAFSISEVAHGPMALVGQDTPLLVFPPAAPGDVGLGALLAKFAARGARIAIAGRVAPDCLTLPVPADVHAVLAPLVMAQSFYPMVNQLALARGHDPDRPPLLNKVTETR